MGEHVQAALGDQLSRQGDLPGLRLRLTEDFLSPIGQQRHRGLPFQIGLVDVGGAAVNDGLVAAADCSRGHLLLQNAGDQRRLLRDGIFVLIAGNELQGVNMVGAVGADFHHRSAEGPGQAAIFTLRVQDDNIVLRSKGHIHNGVLHAHGLAGAGHPQIEPMGRDQPLAVTDQRILADLMDAIGQAAGVLELLGPEGNRHGAAFGGEGMQGMDSSESVGQGGVQAVLLLEAGGGDVAKMLLADGKDALRVCVQLLQAVGSMNKGDDGEDHPLITQGQIVHILPGVVPPLLHAAGDFGGEVVPGVLPLLPAGDVRLHAENDAIHLLHRFIGGYRDQVNGQDQVAGILGKIGDQIVGHKRGVAAQEQDTAKLLPKGEVVASEADGVGADEITEVSAASHEEVIVVVKILLLAGAEEVMEDAEPVIVSGRLDAGVQAGKGLLKISPGPPEIGPAFLNFSLGDGKGHKALLDKVVALGRPVFHDLVGFLPVVIQPVIPIGQQDAALKLGGVQPVVHNGDLGGGVGGQRVQRGTVGREDAVLRLLGGGDVVHIRQLPGAAVFFAHLPYAVGVDPLDGNALLDGMGNLHFHTLAPIGRCQGFNQSLHAPFC